MALRKIGEGVTDSNGRCIISYTGTGAGLLQLKGQCADGDSIVQSRICEVLDTLLYDTGIDSLHNIWTGNTSNLTRSNEYSTLAESEEGVAVVINTVLPKGLWVLEMKVKRDGGSTNWNITIMNGNTAVFGVATPTNDVWSDIKIVYDGAKIYCLANGSLTPLKTQNAVLDDALTYHLRIQTPQTITYVDFKDLTILRNDVDSIAISATKGIIQTDETTILSGRLYESGVLVKNTSLDIYKNNVKLGTVQTDNNGVASYTYTGVNGGLCEFTFKVGRIQSEIYETIDGTFKDIGTSSDHNDSWTFVSSTIDRTRAESYTTLTRKADSSSFGYVVKVLGLTDFAIEFDMQFNQSPSASNVWIMSFRESSTTKLRIEYSLLDFSDTEWHHLKFEGNSQSIAYYLDGVKVRDMTPSGTIDRFQFECRDLGFELNYKNFVIYPI